MKWAPSITAATILLLIIAGAFFRDATYREMVATCKNDGNRFYCLEPLVLDVILREGFEEGFDLIRWFYTHDSNLASRCYFFTQRVASGLYEHTPTYENFSLTPSTAYCNFGFFHEYPKQIILHTQNPERGKAFCEYAHQSLHKSVPGIREECFRGVGGGLPLIAIQASPQEKAAYAIDWCERLAEGDDRITCISGVFNGLGKSLRDQVSLDPDAPLSFKFCETLSGEYRNRCYGNFKHSFIEPYEQTLTEENFLLKVAEIKKLSHENPEYLNASVWTLSYTAGKRRTLEDDYEPHLNSCSELPLNLQEKCLEGFALGLAKNGLPEREYQAVFSFCKQAKERGFAVASCPVAALDFWKDLYSEGKYAKICLSFNKEFDSKC